MKKFSHFIMNMTFELLESLGLLVCVILASPLGFFRRLDRTFQVLSFVRYMIPRGMLAPYLRARLDFRMGNLQQSANILSQLAGILEEEVGGQKMLVKGAGHRLLVHVYSELLQIFLLSGDLEDAALVVIRAFQQLRIDRLPHNPSFDVKTAHIVKAGIAAGKLLEEGGLATLMVKPGEEPIVSSGSYNTHHNLRGKKIPRRKKDHKGAKVIPFPLPN